MCRRFVRMAGLSFSVTICEKFRKLSREHSLTDLYAHSNFLKLVSFGGTYRRKFRTIGYDGSEILKEDFDGKDDPDPDLRGDVQQDWY